MYNFDKLNITFSLPYNLGNLKKGELYKLEILMEELERLDEENEYHKRKISKQVQEIEELKSEIRDYGVEI